MAETLEESLDKCGLVGGVSVGRVGVVFVQAAAHGGAAVPAREVDIELLAGLAQGGDAVHIDPTVQAFGEGKVFAHIVEHPLAVFEREPMIGPTGAAGQLDAVQLHRGIRVRRKSWW